MFDPVGGPDVDMLARAMGDEGILFIYGGLSGKETVFPHWPAALKGLSIRGWVASAIWNKPERYARAQNLDPARPRRRASETGDRENLSARTDRGRASVPGIESTARQDRRYGELMNFRKLALSLVLIGALAPLAAQAAFKPGAPTVLVTGANRGIGLEIARQYAAKDWNVIATTRRPIDDQGTDELKAIQKAHPNLVIERVDVTDTAMIRSVQAKYKEQPLDVLINNAAAVEATFQADLEKVNIPYDKIDFDAARNDFDVNTLGPMRMIQAFMP